MQSLYLLQNPKPEPPTNFQKVCMEVQSFCEWILPPDPTPEQKIARELSKLKAERDAFMREADDLRSDMRIQSKFLRQYERDRDHEGIERAVKQQVRIEKREQFLLRQVDKMEKCIEEATTIKSDQQQMLSLLIIMNATSKKSVPLSEAKRVVDMYAFRKENDTKMRDMIEMVLDLEGEEEDVDQFTEADQKKIDERIKLSKDVGDQKMMDSLPMVTGIIHQTNDQGAFLTQRELELQCKRDEKKIENYLMGIK